MADKYLLTTVYTLHSASLRQHTLGCVPELLVVRGGDQVAVLQGYRGTFMEAVMDLLISCVEVDGWLPPLLWNDAACCLVHSFVSNFPVSPSSCYHLLIVLFFGTLFSCPSILCYLLCIIFCLVSCFYVPLHPVLFF